MIQHQNDNKVQNRWQTKAAILQQECLYQLYPKINLQMFKMITKKINMVIPDCLLAKNAQQNSHIKCKCTIGTYMYSKGSGHKTHKTGKR